jgi:hypothetical protein
MSEDKPRCSQRVFGERCTNFICGNSAKYFENGKWYCGIHCAASVAKRGEKKEKKYKEFSAKIDNKINRMWLENEIVRTSIDWYTSNDMAEERTALRRAIYNFMESRKNV